MGQYTHPSEKYEVVNWDNDIPTQYEWENKMDGNQTTNQIVKEHIFGIPENENERMIVKVLDK